jgi:hypothetical protein
MPTFDTFKYMFTLDILEISKFSLGILMFVSMSTVIFAPSLFDKLFGKTEIKYCFIYSQYTYICGTAVLLILAYQLNLAFSIPHIAILAFTDVFAGVIEKILTLLPSNIIVAQIVPPGVEASMSAFTSTIVTFNMFAVRGLVGVFINNTFFHVTRETISNFY